MEFDRQVARLFGALLERSEVDANVVANVVKVFEDDGQDPRKLLVVLLLATEGAVNLSKLSAEARQRFEPLRAVGANVSVDEFFSVVSRRRLWRFFFEAVAFLPLSTHFLECDVIERHQFKRDDDFASTAFVAALIRKFRTSPARDADVERVLERHVERFLENLGGKNLSEKILSVLFLSTMALSDNVADVVADVQNSSKSDIWEYFSFDVDETTLSPIKSSVIEKLLCGHYVELAKSISVDFWLDLVDEKTVDILRNDCVNFWYISMTQLPSSFTFTSGSFYFLVDARCFLWRDENLYSLSDAKANT